MSEYELWNELGKVYFTSGAYDEAIKAYNRAIELDPGFGWPYSNMALTYTIKGRYEEAISLYLKSIALLDDDREKAVSWNRLGNLYRKLKDYDNAIDAFQKADKFDLDSAGLDQVPVLLDTPGIDDSVNGDMSEGSDNSLLERDPRLDLLKIGHTNTTLSKEFTPFVIDPPPADPGLAVEIAMNGQAENHAGCPDDNNVAETKEPVQESAPPDGVIEDPLDQPLVTQQGSLVDESLTVDMDLVEMSQAPLDESSSATGTAQETLGIQSPYWVLKEEIPATQEPCSPALEQYMPGGSTAIQYPGSSAQRDHLLSELALDESVHTAVLFDGLVSQDPSGHENGAVDKEGGHENFNEQRDKVLQEDGQDNLGDLAGQIGKFKRVVEINPANAAAWGTLGDLFKSIGHYSDAISSYERAIALEPSRAPYYYYLGLVYAAQKHYDAAFSAFQKVIELDPGYSLAHATLAGYYHKLGQEAEAQKHIEIASSTFQGENEYNRACFEAICGNMDQAIELLRVSLENKQTTVDWIRRDPDLDFIREDPRFKALVGDV